MGFDTPTSHPPPQAPADPLLTEQQTVELARRRRDQERNRRGIESLRIEPGLSPASTNSGLRIPN